MFAGILLGAPTLRLRGDYLAIVTLGFGEIITIFANNLYGITGGSQGSALIPHLVVPRRTDQVSSGVSTPVPYYYLTLVFVVLFLIAFSLLEHSRVGRAWTAIREDEVAAESVGINPLKYKVMAFAIGASTAGFAGVVTASQSNNIFPSSFTLSFSINILVLVIFGGMGSIFGVVLGAMIIQTALDVPLVAHATRRLPAVGPLHVFGCIAGRDDDLSPRGTGPVATPQAERSHCPSGPAKDTSMRYLTGDMLDE